MLTPSRRGTLWLLAGAVLISFSPVLVQVSHVGPTTAAFYRMLFGGIVLVGVAVVRRSAGGWGLAFAALAVAAGLLLAIDVAAWHRSIHAVGPGLATILANFQVFFLAAYGIAVLRERAGWRFLVAVPLSLLGLVLVFGLGWGALSPDFRLGIGWGIFAAACYAAYLVVLRRTRVTAGFPGLAATVGGISVAAAAALMPAVWALGESFHIPDAQSWAALLAYGVVVQVGGWLLITLGIPHVPASRVGLMLLLQPALAFVWDVVLFGRATAAVEWAGVGLALGAIYLGGGERRGT